MPRFGPTSRARLETCDHRLRLICEYVVGKIDAAHDFSVICGHRSDEEQEARFREGKSKARAGQSKHNVYPSLAVDLAPYPYPPDTPDQDRVLREKLSYIAGAVKHEAARQGIKLTWGGDWGWDFFHFEIAEEEDSK